MKILNTKTEIVLEGNEQLVQIPVPDYLQTFNTWHDIQLDRQGIPMPTSGRPVRVKTVILLVEEREPV